MKTFIRFMCGLIVAGALVVGLFYRTERDLQNRSDNIWLIALAVAGTAMLGLFWVGRGPFKSKRDLTPDERLRHNVQRVASVIIVCFLLISLQLLRNSVVIAGEIEKPFEGRNARGQAVVIQDPRTINQKLANQRGRIFDAAGQEVAGISTSKYNLVKRTYKAESPIKQLLGYFSPLQFGNSGLEAEYDEYLSGKFGINPFVSLRRSILNQPTVGSDLYLTIDPKLQQAAQDALGPIPGSIVLMDAKSGAVLAMTGFPRYDPEALVFDPTVDDTLWNDQIQDISKRWQALNADPAAPLLLRSTQGLYTPGSIFKTVTLAAMLDSGKTTPESTWEDRGFLLIDSHRINDPNRPNTNNSIWTTRQGFMFSLNAVFAQMGMQLGAEGLTKYSQSFGLDKKVPFDLYTEASRTQVEDKYLQSRAAQADTGFGQGQLLLTPLHAALIAASIGRGDGVLPQPYLVQEIKTHDGDLVKRADPKNWIQAVRPETARIVRDIMIASAKEGYVGLNGGGLPATGALIGGKTGTAEIGNGLNNGWYIAWASKGDRLFSIAVVVDHRSGAEGLRDALPRANQVLTAALAGVK